MNLSGSPVDYVLAFFGGILISLTPCFYPLIPVSIGYVSTHSNGSKAKAFVLSVTFVTGVAITYSVLGLIASLTGAIFGKISTHPVTYIIIGIIIAVFGILVWTDSLNFSFSKSGKPENKKKGYLAILLLGIASGFMISPCLTPALASILAFIATKKNIAYGMSLLVCFAYGMGFILILASASSSILINLPKSGKWMVYMKRIVAIVLIIMGCYFAFNGIKQFLVTHTLTEKQDISEQAALDFKLKDLDQNTVTLSSFKDKKPVIFLFWTTWCPYCRSELNVLKNEYSQLAKDGIELLAISVGEPRYKVDNFVKNRGFGFKFLLDEDALVSQSYDLLGVPTYFIVNKSGKIVFTGGHFPKNKLRQLLKE